MKVWIHLNDVQEGPFRLEELPLHRMGPDTPVWYEGLADWMEAKDAPLTAPFFVKQEPQAPKFDLEKKIEEPAAPAEDEAVVDDSHAEPEMIVVDQKEEDAAEEPAKADEPGEEDEEDTTPSDKPMPNPGFQRPYQRPFQQPQPQRPYQQPYPEENEDLPNTFLPWAILLTVLCCNPIGIISIILGINTKARITQGDIKSAKKISETNEWFLIITIVTSIVFWPLTLFMF